MKHKGKERLLAQIRVLQEAFVLVTPFFADINECKESRPCGNQAKCENKPGAYKCVCRDGYAFYAEVKKCLGKE